MNDRTERLFVAAKTIDGNHVSINGQVVEITSDALGGNVIGHKLPARLLRFAAVGVTCYFVQLGLLHLLQSVVHLYVADVAAFVLSAQINYGLSLALTWSDRRHSERALWQWLKFNANALLSVTLVNAGVFWLLVQTGLQLWLAMLFANAVSAGCTFTINHLFVFTRGRDRPPTSREERE